MPHVRYIGRDPDGLFIVDVGHCPHGGTIEVSEALAAELVDREAGTQWESAKAPKTAAAVTPETES